MDLQLKGKKALVTGSTAGIGLAIARELAAEGAQVVVNGRTQKRVDEALKSVAGGVGVAADMGTAAGAAAVIAQHPDVDILVNNVGIFAAKPYDQIPDAEWLQFFETNVLSGVRLSRHYLPRMVARGFGRVLFISSESGLQIPAEMIHYGMTKTAQLAVARGLAESVAGTGVTVNSVLPGPTRSEGVGQFVESVAAQRGVTTQQMEKEFFQHMRPSSLLKRFETVEEIAHMVTYLASPLASGTTGSAVRVDGGVVRAI
jgi:NAD(P)-dependent dehydrogenase (short-subunit alcohol dehydrogenase family)